MMSNMYTEGKFKGENLPLNFLITFKVIFEYLYVKAISGPTKKSKWQLDMNLFCGWVKTSTNESWGKQNDQKRRVLD